MVARRSSYGIIGYLCKDTTRVVKKNWKLDEKTMRWIYLGHVGNIKGNLVQFLKESV
jgi:hypothetical protein